MTHLCRVCGEAWLQFCKLYESLSSLLYPMFHLQLEFQRGTLGEAFWRQKVSRQQARRKKEQAQAKSAKW